MSTGRAKRPSALNAHAHDARRQKSSYRTCIVVSESLATSDEITVWAQLSVTVPPSELGVGDEAKAIWRSDGSGDFHVVAISPSGREVPPEFLTPHLSSNWERPASASRSPDAGSSRSGTEMRARDSG
jgi:hypothetical protein